MRKSSLLPAQRIWLSPSFVAGLDHCWRRARWRGTSKPGRERRTEFPTCKAIVERKLEGATPVSSVKVRRMQVVVRRGEGVPEGQGPIVICTRNDDLQGVLDATPAERCKGTSPPFSNVQALILPYRPTLNAQQSMLTPCHLQTWCSSKTGCWSLGWPNEDWLTTRR